jgi:hypothetical protein
MKLITKEFVSYSAERAIKTFAQTAIAALGAGSIGLLTIDYVNLFSVAGGAALLSLLTSVVTTTSVKK